MRIFNRLIMILLLAGLFVLGVYTVVYAFDLLGYRLSDLPIPAFTGGLQDFVSGVEEGNLSLREWVILIAVALLGLVLLIAELKPPAPRRVRMQKGTYTTRKAVENEVIEAAEGTHDVLGSSAKVKARRRPGAVVSLSANVRRGEDQGTLKNDLRDAVQRRLASRGIPVSKLRVRLVESDPRETKTRVK
ncbi:MAG: hypothetical protein AB1425_15020 [Actinomycetota bacterium]